MRPSRVSKFARIWDGFLRCSSSSLLDSLVKRKQMQTEAAGMVWKRRRKEGEKARLRTRRQTAHHAAEAIHVATESVMTALKKLLIAAMPMPTEERNR